MLILFCLAGLYKSVRLLNYVRDSTCFKTQVKHPYLLGSQVAEVWQVGCTLAEDKFILLCGGSGSIAQDLALVKLDNSICIEVCLVKVMGNYHNKLFLGNLLQHR